MIPVTSADRERAAEIVRWQTKATREWKQDGDEAWQFFAPGFSRAIIQGIWDDHPLVQAFAAHRLAALGEAAGVAEEGWGKYNEPTERDYGAQDACVSIARAIRALTNPTAQDGPLPVLNPRQLDGSEL